MCPVRSNLLLIAVTIVGLIAATPSVARIVGIEVTERSLFADGLLFDGVGAYERIDGVATGELAPDDSDLSGIQALDLAALNQNGRISYKTPFTIMRPVPPTQAPRKLLYEVVNRGDKLILPWLNKSPETSLAALNNPRSTQDIGNGFLFRQGYTLIWSGWSEQPLNSDSDDTKLFASLPQALQDGEKVRSRIRYSWLVGGRGLKDSRSIKLPNSMYGPEAGTSRLYRRCSPEENFEELEANLWHASIPQSSITVSSDADKTGCQYSLSYVAEGSPVAGVGFAAIRDLMGFFRYHTGSQNPLAPSTYGVGREEILGLGISQSGRLLRSFVELGMNTDTTDRAIFDGLFIHIAGAGKIFANALFAQPARTLTSYADAGYPEIWPPYSYADAFYKKRAAQPYIVETNTSSEYWQKAAYLLHTAPDGSTDLDLPEWSRTYLIAGMQHGSRPNLVSRRAGNCAYPTNPSDPSPVLRSLLVRLGQWVRHEDLPPPNNIPRLKDGTLTRHADLALRPDIAAPPRPNCISSVSDNGNERPKPCTRGTSATSPVLVPQQNPAGNEIAGIHLPQTDLSLGTYTGWNIYDAPFAHHILCDRAGAYFPLQDKSNVSRDDIRESLVVLAGQGFVLDDEIEELTEEIFAKARSGLPVDFE